MRTRKRSHVAILLGVGVLLAFATVGPVLSQSSPSPHPDGGSSDDWKQQLEETAVAAGCGVPSAFNVMLPPLLHLPPNQAPPVHRSVEEVVLAQRELLAANGYTFSVETVLDAVLDASTDGPSTVVGLPDGVTVFVDRRSDGTYVMSQSVFCER